ncbi:MAG: hypothetical protein E6R03_02210 [Hyphomicrobiaceae bacterium]|nr:MAG: hypothetical protein E6R03_02210 [Hyphomicrobiaceae bacterium]
MNATDYRAHCAASSPTADIPMPSGAVFTLRRPPLEVWMAAGKVPQSLLRRIAAAGDGNGKLDMAESLDVMQFLGEAMRAACVSPRLSPDAHPDDPEVLNPAELAPEDFEFLALWIARGCPGVPVATKGGGVETDDLAKFRASGQGT